MAREPVVAYVALGANLGDAANTVRCSMQAIGALEQVELLQCSSLYRTAPVDAGGPDFINAVVSVRTTGTAYDLLAGLQRLEQAALRDRAYRNAPRTLDLDLLLFGDGTIHSATMQVPHPRMGARAFVLVPLAQIAPERVAPAALRAVASQPCERLAGPV